MSRLAERWDIPKGDWHTLLGRHSPNTIRNWATSDQALEADVQERLSHLVSIYDALHRIFGDEAFADAWLHRAHVAFGGQAPLDRMRSGKFSDLYDVRLYLDQALV